jgi:hypothetical protein
LKLSKGRKAKKLPPKSFKIPKTQQSAQALKESKRGKKKKERCIQMLQATKKLNSKKLPPKSFKLPKTQQSAQASFFFLFRKNQTMIQPCAPKILQPTQNLN